MTPHLTAEVLAAYLDGGLPPADRREADAHLAACSECVDILATLFKTLQELSAAGLLPAPLRFDPSAHRR